VPRQRSGYISSVPFSATGILLFTIKVSLPMSATPRTNQWEGQTLPSPHTLAGRWLFPYTGSGLATYNSSFPTTPPLTRLLHFFACHLVHYDGRGRLSLSSTRAVDTSSPPIKTYANHALSKLWGFRFSTLSLSTPFFGYMMMAFAFLFLARDQRYGPASSPASVSFDRSLSFSFAGWPPSPPPATRLCKSFP